MRYPFENNYHRICLRAISARRLPLVSRFQGACGACHHDGGGPPLLGANVPLALSSKLHSDRPDNLIRTILDGVQHPPSKAVGFMPALSDALDGRQIAEIATYMRSRYAPQQPAWSDLEARVGALR